jgi:hypothetical protein
MDSRKNRSNERKPLPWVATGCRVNAMVRRGSTVRVRQRAYTKAVISVAALRHVRYLLAVRRGVDARCTVTSVHPAPAVECSRVSEAVAVHVVGARIAEERVVAAVAGRRAADGIVVADDRAVVATAAPDSVVAAGPTDRRRAGQRRVVPDDVAVVSVAAGKRVIAARTAQKIEAPLSPTMKPSLPGPPSIVSFPPAPITVLPTPSPQIRSAPGSSTIAGNRTRGKSPSASGAASATAATIASPLNEMPMVFLWKICYSRAHVR